MATAKKWDDLIRKCCTDAGTYQPCFDSVIRTLADILEQRDKTYTQYKKSGAIPVIEYTNKGGATNPSKNPLLILWDELNKTALTYWRELGLTPSGLRKINEQAMSPKRKLSSLDQALSELG